MEMNYVDINLSIFGLILIFVGITLILASIIYLMYKLLKGEGGKMEGGGVVVIGHIPIAFGTSEKITKFLLVIALIFFVIMLLLYLLPFYVYKVHELITIFT